VESVLDLIRRDRRGEVTDVSIIRACVACFEELGVDDDSRYGRVKFYKSEFENKFLEV
jgi:hypothetical protein